MAAPAPSDLDKKYMLLSACFPGIQIRKLTHKRYLEKKEEIRRNRESSLVRKCSLPSISSQPSVSSLPTTKSPPSGPFDQLNRSAAHPLPRVLHVSGNFSVDSASAVLLKPGNSTLWEKKLAKVQKKMRDFDNVTKNVRKTL